MLHPCTSKRAPAAHQPARCPPHENIIVFQVAEELYGHYSVIRPCAGGERGAHCQQVSGVKREQSQVTAPRSSRAGLTRCGRHEVRQIRDNHGEVP